MSTFPPQITELPAFDGPFDAHRLNAEQCDVLFASYPAGTWIPPHEHDTDNVGVVTSGVLVLILNGVESRYGAGDWYRVPARTSHAARFDVETTEIEFWFQP